MAEVTAELAVKLEKLRGVLREASPVMIAYSGGVDSTTLLAVACETPGVHALGVIADSPSLPRAALAGALAEAERWGWPVEVLRTRELEDERYAANPPNRCYFCKAELFARMEEHARQAGVRSLAYGENADDVEQSRPGSVAAREFAVLAPLRMAGLGKREVRWLAAERGLAAADAPATPCLSSRIAHGVRVSEAVLALVERAEAVLARRGFRIFRVRIVEAGEEGRGARALVQASPRETGRLLRMAEEVRAELTGMGFGFVEFDADGYRGPSLEEPA